MRRKLIVFALMLCVASVSSAQVEFRTQFEKLEDILVWTYGVTDDQMNTAEYLFLMSQEGEFCTKDIRESVAGILKVCVFEDTELDASFLYIADNAKSYSMVFHNGELVAPILGGHGIAFLEPGDYELHVYHSVWESDIIDLLAKITFTVSDTPESVEFNIKHITKERISNEYHDLSSEHAIVAEYLSRTQSDNYCTGKLPPRDTPGHSKVCVFVDPRTSRYTLYSDVGEGREIDQVSWIEFGDIHFTQMIVSHNGQIIAILGGGPGDGISDLPSGEYELDIFHYVDNGSWPILQFGTISFTIPAPTDTPG